jgi:hypothetical protein
MLYRKPLKIVLAELNRHKFGVKIKYADSMVTGRNGSVQIAVPPDAEQTMANALSQRCKVKNQEEVQTELLYEYMAGQEGDGMNSTGIASGYQEKTWKNGKKEKVN